jgi:transcription elongation factor GreA
MRSPLARALIGKDEGDSIEVRTPGGARSYEILKVEFI